MKKFSGEAKIFKEGNSLEIEDISVAAEDEWFYDAFDAEYDLREITINDDNYNQLNDGYYHLFFIGEYNFWIDHTMDGDEQDCEFYFNYSSYKKLPELEGD